MDNGFEIDYDKFVFHKEYKRVQPSQSLIKPMLEDYWVAEIQPRQSGDLLKALKETVPTDPSLRHLKRFRKRGDKLECIACKCDFMEKDELQKRIDRSVEPHAILYKKGIPMNKPLDKEINTEWSDEYWPIVWKGNPMVQELNESYKEFDKAVVEKHLEEIVERADGKIATMFVDPADDTVKSVQCDQRTEHDPMNHSTMACIAEIAAAELERRKVAAAAAGGGGSDSSTNNYLCLNYDVYTTHEPCTMCAMALLHSRVRRLFYIAPSPLTGGIGEDSGCRYMIHLACRLNWKYEAFQYTGSKFKVEPVSEEINI